MYFINMFSFIIGTITNLIYIYIYKKICTKMKTIQFFTRIQKVAKILIFL